MLSEGTVEPGYYDNGNQYKNNIDKIKGLKQRVVDLNIPIKIEHNSNIAGERREFVMTPSGYKRSLAEAWALNTSFYFAPEGVTLTNIVKGTSVGTNIVQAIGDYNVFKQNRSLLWLDTKLIADSQSTDIISIKNTQGEELVNILVTISENDEFYYIQLVNYNETSFSCINLFINETVFSHSYSDFIVASPDQNTFTQENCNNLNENTNKKQFSINNLNIYSVISIKKSN